MNKMELTIMDIIPIILVGLAIWLLFRYGPAIRGKPLKENVNGNGG